MARSGPLTNSRLSSIQFSNASRHRHGFSSGTVWGECWPRARLSGLPTVSRFCA